MMMIIISGFYNNMVQLHQVNNCWILQEKFVYHGYSGLIKFRIQTSQISQSQGHTCKFTLNAWTAIFISSNRECNVVEL